MADLIPGYDYVGRGFDVFGTFDIRSLAQKERLFNTNTPSNQTYMLGEKAYTVPQNTAVLEVKAQQGRAVFFSQKSDVSEFFSAQAGIEGNYMAFSAAFEAAFSSIAKRVSEYQFGMFYLTTEGFAVEVVEATPDQLLPAVKADPDFMNIPTKYTADNEYLFFRFFAKYGTHFVRSVNLGGRLLYSVAIDKSYQFSQQDFETKLTAEYKATFDVAAYAQVEWQNVGQVWADNRMVTIDAIGGDTSLLNGLKQSEPPDNFNQAFESWIASLPTAYGATNFALSGVDQLFSGDQAIAVRQAIEAYTQQHLFMKARGGNAAFVSGSIIVGGQPIALPALPQGNVGGLGVAVIDRTTLNPLFFSAYPIGAVSPAPINYTKVVQDLAPYKGNSSVIVALLWWAQSGYGEYPSLDLRNFLYSCGAGSGFERWGDISEFISTNAQYCSYAFVGIPGWSYDQALEEFAQLPVPPLNSTSFPSYPALELQGFLKPEYTNQGIQYTPR